MKSEKQNELIKLLARLKKERLTSDFGEKYKYNAPHLSQILAGRIPGIHYIKALILDINEYYEKKSK